MCLVLGYSNLSLGFAPLVYVSLLFLELTELGTGLSGALSPGAPGCAGQEAKAKRSGPVGPREPSILFGDPHASSYSQPSLRQGHSWAGSGQSARLGTSVLASRIKGKEWGGGWGGSEPSPQSLADACFLDRRRRQQRTPDAHSFFFPLGKSERIGVGKWGFLSCLHLSRSPIRYHMGTHSWRTAGCSCPAGAAQESPEAPAPGIPRKLRAGRMRNGSRLQRTRARLGSEAEAGAPRKGRVKNNSINISKTFGCILGKGQCFLKNLRTAKPLSKTKPKSLTTDHFAEKRQKNPSDTSPLVPPRKSSLLAKPGAWTPLHHPSALAPSPGRPLPTLHSRVGPSLCHSAGARCPVPGAGGRRGGAEAPA